MNVLGGQGMDLQGRKEKNDVIVNIRMQSNCLNAHFLITLIRHKVTTRSPLFMDSSCGYARHLFYSISLYIPYISISMLAWNLQINFCPTTPTLYTPPCLHANPFASTPTYAFTGIRWHLISPELWQTKWRFALNSWIRSTYNQYLCVGTVFSFWQYCMGGVLIFSIQDLFITY